MTEMLFAVGAGAHVVAVDSLSNYPPQAPITDLSAYTPNAEAIAAYQPDLVVLTDDIADIVGQLTALSIPVYVGAAADTTDDTYRELTSDLMGLYHSSLSNRMNEVMQVLTVIATIFIPLTFIVGVYGMNFNPLSSPWNMPELNAYWGYPVVWAVMLAATAALLVLFHRKGWLPKRHRKPPPPQNDAPAE